MEKQSRFLIVEYKPSGAATVTLVVPIGDARPNLQVKDGTVASRKDFEVVTKSLREILKNAEIPLVPRRTAGGKFKGQKKPPQETKPTGSEAESSEENASQV